MVLRALAGPGRSLLVGLRRDHIAACCLGLSYIAFFATMVVLPSPIFWEVVPRHVGTIETQYRSLLLYLSDIPLLIAVFAWTLGHILRPSRPLCFGPWYIAGPALAIMLLTALSPIWAHAAPIAAETAGRTIILFGLYLIAANEPRVQRLLAWALAVVVLVNAPLALMQFTTQAPAGLGFLGELQWYENTPGAWLRGYGLSLHPNVLGGFLALGLLGLIGLKMAGNGFVVASVRARSANILVRVAYTGALALGVAGLLSTFSRSAWLGFGGGLMYFCFLTLRQVGVRRALPSLSLSILPLIVVSLVFMFFNSGKLTTRLVLPVASVLRDEAVPGAQLEMGVLEERNRLHQGAIGLIATEPVLGVGAGNFTIAYYEQVGPFKPYMFYQPEHNVPLLVTAELGPLGGIAWLFLVVAPLVVSLRGAFRDASIWPYVWAAAILAVLLISGFDFYFWERQQGRVLFWVLLGVWAALSRQAYGLQRSPD